jgi:Rrf2 family iron-sulfur cluster assembly transcriptional regulator
LGKPPAEIAVADVIAAVDETVDATRCGGQKNCQHDLPCLTHDLWEDLNRQIRNFLGGVSLGDLINRGVTREIANRQDVFVLQRRNSVLNS